MIVTKQLASSVPSSQQRFIVHKESEAQKLPDFEAVRVSVPASVFTQTGHLSTLDQSCSPPAARSPGRHLKVVTGAAW